MLAVRLHARRASYLPPVELEELKEFEPRYRKRFNSNYDLSKFTSQMMLHNLDKDAEILVRKTWVVLPHQPEKSLLITGELPFISTQGFASPKSNYIFPVTPSLALVLTGDLKSLPQTMDLDKLWGFAHLNFCIVINNREVYFFAIQAIRSSLSGSLAAGIPFQKTQLSKNVPHIKWLPIFYCLSADTLSTSA